MIPARLLNDKYFREEYERHSDAGRARMAFEFKAGIRDKKTGEVKKAHQDSVNEAFKAEEGERKSGVNKIVSRPVNNAERAMKSKEIKL